MNVSRRSLLQSAFLLGALSPLAGCERLSSEVTKRLGEGVPDKVGAYPGETIDPDFHFLSRTTYGCWPGDLDYLKSVGQKRWLDEQLHPDTIDDKACVVRTRRFETLNLDAGTCYEFKKTALQDDLVRHAVLTATYTKRQLLETMVGFWSDHLNIYSQKADCIYLKGTDDRAVIRAHALGKFKDLIRASASSPAMLVYLDGKENKKAKPSDVPNENYARELLELHTMGVHGGYSQQDVSEVARCLTGWRVRDHWQRGDSYFDLNMHDQGQKKVLGQTISALGGSTDLDQVVEVVCKHPSTAMHIATKLVRHFVAEDPPASLVKQIAATFASTDGDIKSILSALFASDEFKGSAGQKIKRPMHFVISSLRATASDTFAHKPMLEYLSRMGELPFQHPTPDGYPDVGRPWLGTLLWRWNFAFALLNGTIPQTQVPLTDLMAAVTGPNLFAYFIGRKPTPTELSALSKIPSVRSDLLVALILASPAFQRY
jgi:uncharacterized protein (DUF1800 family)